MKYLFALIALFGFTAQSATYFNEQIAWASDTTLPRNESQYFQGWSPISQGQTLDAVEITIINRANLTVGTENTSAAPYELSATANSVFAVTVPGSTQFTPGIFDMELSDTWTAPAFDGVTDFGGTSGRTVSGSDSISHTLTVDEDDLHLFNGETTFFQTTIVAVLPLGSSGNTVLAPNVSTHGYEVRVKFIFSDPEINEPICYDKHGKQKKCKKDKKPKKCKD
jgi:hypothetical protein